MATTQTELELQPFIGGNAAETSDTYEVRAPYDDQLVAVIHRAGPDEIEHAIARAEAAFQTTRKLPSWRRAEILEAVSAAIKEQRDDFARTIALEAGKPIRTARGEADRAAFTFKVAAEESKRIYGEIVPLDWLPGNDGRFAHVRRVPLGPIAGITPFNFPLNLVAHKVAPAIAAGGPLVLKTAAQTPFTALLLAGTVQQAGGPDGGLNVLPLSNADAGLLVSDERIKLISFTGSAAVGWKIKNNAGKKKVVLELGGNAGVIVHSDADLEFAAERCAVGGFSYAGQTCISVQRILVERSVFKKFTDLLLAGVSRLQVGNPMEESTDLGPLIRESDAIRASDWVTEAVQGGATLLCGGKRHGSMLEPTVLTGTRPDMKVNCQEIFAPVVTIESYDDFSMALRRINESPYGLQAGVFTRDANRIFQAYDELEVGGVIAGDVPSFRIDHMPYGGVKDSGLGREGLRYAIEEMTEPKLLVMNLR